MLTLPSSWPAHTPRQYAPWWRRWQLKTNAMAPTIPADAEFFAEEAHPHDWAQVQDRVVVVQTVEGSMLCGRVLENELATTSGLLLHFDGAHKPRQQYLPAEQIAGLWVAVCLVERQKVR
ncbi:hypothetical protein [Hymenobacter sp. DG01]|uniref:hypothetical protein n=1 Tax=Hymenobacter sp. DG01 TaxID=2584940 RepID=UPI00112255EF|nr:hypothetical protein [Hymenobacter sp. DG01]